MNKGRDSDNIPMNLNELKESNLRYEDIIDSIPVGMLIFQVGSNGSTQIIAVNDWLVRFANQLHLYIGEKTDSWDKASLSEQFQNNILTFTSNEDLQKVKEFIDRAIDQGYSQCVFILKGTGGDNKIWIRSMCSAKRLGDGSVMLYTIFEDYTKQYLYEKKLQEQKASLIHISHYDSMTNIQNRHSYQLFLENSKQKPLENTGILFADINGLKYVNDTYGHNFGDTIIIEFGDILKKYFEDKCIFRISGDEFVVVLTDHTLDEFKKSIQDFVNEVTEMQIASIGYIWDASIHDVKQEVFKAEQLMHIQKRQYYAENNNSNFSRYRPVLLNKLLQDMNDNKYFIVLQPKADIHSTKVIGAEALVRKRGDHGEMIPPYEFVPLLEKEMLISRVDFLVLEEVCKLLQQWKHCGKRLIKVSVNLSRVTIAENNLIEHIMQICEKYQVEHQYIEFEITESTDTKDENKLLAVVKRLHDLGFSISLDDMGNDYSSIKMLTIKDIDIVKLDRSMILGMREKEGSSLVRYIIALCHEIGKKCIAEGVENKEQQDILAKMNCDYYQGYLLNRPISVEMFEQYVS